MKQILTGLLIVLALSIIGCDDQLTSEFRPLHKISWEKDQVSSGSFFLLIGNVKSSSELTVKMYRQRPDGDYQLISLPMKRVLVRLDESVKTPTAAIQWENEYEDNEQRVLDHEYEIDKVIVKCSPNDWKITIQMPLDPQSKKFESEDK